MLGTYHGKGVAEALRTSREGSELGLGDLLEELAASPRNGGEEFGGHRWQRGGNGGMGGGLEGRSDGLKVNDRLGVEEVFCGSCG